MFQKEISTKEATPFPSHLFLISYCYPKKQVFFLSSLIYLN